MNFNQPMNKTMAHMMPSSSLFSRTFAEDSVNHFQWLPSKITWLECHFWNFWNFKNLSGKIVTFNHILTTRQHCGVEGVVSCEQLLVRCWLGVLGQCHGQPCLAQAWLTSPASNNSSFRSGEYTCHPHSDISASCNITLGYRESWNKRNLQIELLNWQ